jgi:hypothetical protein
VGIGWHNSSNVNVWVFLRLKLDVGPVVVKGGAEG